ncbi:MAG: hypothetical protein J7497_13075, partial [Chitinophagaceae bacterium]|nr:hypothetical protein [Chitinophagaceae bacterium]
VALSRSSVSSRFYFATVNGDFTMNGNSTFSIQNSNAVTNPTTLYVKGNIIHNSGVITASSTATASSVSLFNIEMNGTTAKTIKSTPQAFNNGNNEVALVINNSAGVTLTTPLQVGMIGFKSNAKLNTTGTNYLTIMNPSTAAYVVSGAGFVDGPVRRVTNSTNEYIFPTGNGTTQRYVSVYPTANTFTTFEALYSNTNTSGNSTLTSPLTGKVAYNWEVDRISTSGANAQIEITLPGAIPGAQSNDAIVVGKSSGGSDWVSAKGSVGTFLPGDATSGTIKSDIQTSFSSFTIVWGPMSAVLPIKLLSFTATKSAKAANLNWKITANSTPAAFDVMKSSDGANFVKIGTLTGMEGKLNYDFIDNNLTAGNNYYRLKMLDKDGTVSYSNIIVVMNGTQGTIINSMIPTMVTDRARLSISSSAKGNMQLVITDINGRIVQTQVAQITQGNQEVWINAARLASGYFQVTGYINGEKTATIRFLKR